jgi:hypothetical protein
MFNRENLNIGPEKLDFSEMEKEIQNQEIETGEAEKENQNGAFLLKEKLSGAETAEIFKRIQMQENGEITDKDAMKILPLFLIERLLRSTEEKGKAENDRNLKGEIKIAGGDKNNIWKHRDNFKWNKNNGEEELKIWRPQFKIKGGQKAAELPKKIILKGEDLKQAIAFLKNGIKEAAG